MECQAVEGRRSHAEQAAARQHCCVEKKEELEAELNDFIKEGEARCSGVLPHSPVHQSRLVPSANSCFPKPINVENTLNQELSSDEEILLKAELNKDATHRQNRIKMPPKDYIGVFLESEDPSSLQH